MTTKFLVFLSNLLSCVSSEHKPLFIPIRLYFIKRHVWRVKMFHKTVNKDWNLFNLSEQSPENSVSRFSIGRKLLSIDRVLFSISWTKIEQQSRHPETPRFCFYHFDRSSQSFNHSKMLYFEFLLRKIQNLNFHFNDFMKQYSPNSNIIITTYYLYIQQEIVQRSKSTK